MVALLVWIFRIQIPLKAIVQNVFSYPRQRTFISDDVIVIVTLPDGRFEIRAYVPDAFGNCC
jgi:hypothetical protein